MIAEIDTRKMKLKEGDMLIHNGENIVKISKDELLKPLQEQINELQRNRLIDAKVNEETIKKSVDKIIKGLVER